MDFAGGLVVHANAGIAALVVAKLLGTRRGFPNDLRPPHNPGMVMIGAAMLWVGWFGFNGGSALGANGVAGMAIAVTHISAATACLVWITIEWIKFGKPSLVGIARLPSPALQPSHPVPALLGRLALGIRSPSRNSVLLYDQRGKVLAEN